VGAYFEGPGQPVDLSLYESLAYDLYIPDPEAFTGILKVEAALDGPFAEIPPGFSDYSVAAAPRVTIAGVTYAVIHRVVPQDVLADRSPSGKLIIRLAAYASTFHGAIYIDDIRMTPVSGTSVKLLAPDRLATVSGRVGVRARVLSPPDQAVSAVTLIAPGGSRTSMTPTGGSNYQGTWDTTGSPGGLQTVAVEAATAGTTVTSRVEVEVDNTGLRVTLLAPRFDATLTGTAQVRVSVVGATPPASVRAKLGEAATALSLDGEGTYTGAIDTRGLPDGPYTLRVDASTAGAGTDTTARAFVDVMVANAPEHWVTRKKGDFLVDGRPFHYAGFNAYDLPFKYPRTLAAREKTLQYDSDGTPLVTVLEAGTILDERAQVDRELIEARKLGMSVVRTWAFNSDRNDQHAFYTPDWSFSEAQFQRLDYVVDSARRHGLKVILTFENYWSSYGGIAATAARFGVPVLEFFSDARCVQMYRAYIAHLIGRTNSVNGRVYREDPTLFAWELMNEPRMGLSEDGTPDRHLYDPTGARLGTWMSETSAYVKSLDPRHLVSPGSEAHGFEGWGGTADGYGSDPLAVMDQPDIDFFTFHPYLNESWSKFTVGAAKKLVTDFVKAGVARRKPVVMEEWGFNKTESVLDLVGNPILPQDVAYDRVRAAWYKLVLATLRREGGDGSNVWMLQTNLQEPNFGITLFTPFDDALADHGLVSTLSYEANLVRVLGGATYIPDVKRKFTDESGYIYEVSYTGLMPLLPGGRFAPMASATVADLVDALARLGIVTAASCNPGAELDMQTAADLLYAGLQLSAYGSELETLQRFDLLPRSTHGDFKPRRRLERAELAELVIRLSDFLLYR
jgi:mannan endo-1,4-beta-mannosidase